jgi:hypothetical protein
MLIASTQVGVIFVIDTPSEILMRTSHLAIFVAVLLAACAHYIETSSPTVARWEARDISELIAAIGPFDTTSIRGESSSYAWSWAHSTTAIPGEYRSYNWFRFGRCRLTAHTSLEGKILKVEMEGTGEGCNVYLQKLGGA